MSKIAKTVYYMNQFFAGIGGEDKADQPPIAFEGAQGPAKLFAEMLGDKGTVVRTVVCGDNYFAEHQEEAIRDLLAMVKEAEPDIFIAGPAFGSGRHGMACAALSSAVAREMGIPAVTAMHPENPGVDMLKPPAYALPAEISAGTMKEVLTRMCAFALKLHAGEPIGPSREEGYLPRGLRLNRIDPLTSAERAVNLLWAKLEGRPYETEIPLPKHIDVAPPPPVEVSKARLGLVTEAGVVPMGNPDNLESWWATHWYSYSIDGLDGLTNETHCTVHAGFENTFMNEDPDRGVPLDMARELEKEGKIGKLADFYLVTTGMMMTTDNAQRIGREMAAHLKKEGIEAVILTST